MTPDELNKAARDKKCVIVPGCIGRIPAAWFAHMQFNLVMRLLPSTIVYKPRAKDKWSKAPWNRRKLIDFSVEVIDENSFKPQS